MFFLKYSPKLSNIFREFSRRRKNVPPRGSSFLFSLLTIKTVPLLLSPRSKRAASLPAVSGLPFHACSPQILFGLQKFQNLGAENSVVWFLHHHRMRRAGNDLDS